MNILKAHALFSFKEFLVFTVLVLLRYLPSYNQPRHVVFKTLN